MTEAIQQYTTFPNPKPSLTHPHSETTTETTTGTQTPLATVLKHRGNHAHHDIQNKGLILNPIQPFTNMHINIKTMTLVKLFAIKTIQPKPKPYICPLQHPKQNQQLQRDKSKPSVCTPEYLSASDPYPLLILFIYYISCTYVELE